MKTIQGVLAGIIILQLSGITYAVDRMDICEQDPVYCERMEFMNVSCREKDPRIVSTAGSAVRLSPCQYYQSPSTSFFRVANVVSQIDSISSVATISLPDGGTIYPATGGPPIQICSNDNQVAVTEGDLIQLGTQQKIFNQLDGHLDLQQTTAIGIDLSQILTEDPDFEAALRVILKKPTGTITYQDIDSITEFHADREIRIQSLRILPDYTRFFFGEFGAESYSEGMLFAHALHFGSVFTNADGEDAFIHGIFVSRVFVPGFFSEPDLEDNVYFVPAILIESRILPGIAVDIRFGWDTNRSVFVPGALTTGVTHTSIGDIDVQFTPGIFDINRDVLPDEGIFEFPSLPGGIPLWDFGAHIPEGMDQGTWLGIGTGIGGLLGALGGFAYGIWAGASGAALINLIGAGATIGAGLFGGVIGIVLLVCWVIDLLSGDDEEESNSELHIEESLSDASEEEGEDDEEGEESSRTGFVDAPGCGTIVQCVDLAMDSFPGSQFDALLEMHFDPLTLQIIDSVLQQ